MAITNLNDNVDNMLERIKQAADKILDSELNTSELLNMMHLHTKIRNDAYLGERDEIIESLHSQVSYLMDRMKRLIQDLTREGIKLTPPGEDMTHSLEKKI